MTTPPFVHLHCHSHYSLLDGAAQISDLVDRTKELGMEALALTDHGNLYGAIEFYRTAKAAGIKPIIGYEAYVAPGHRTRRDAKRSGDAAYHLTLLARNEQGYRNLIRMASAAYLEGFYYRPRIDKELLGQYHEGIICLSGCASGEFSELILRDRIGEATELARWFARLFGEGNFYIEIQDNDLEIQRCCREVATRIAAELGLPLTATCDTHYLCQADASAHDVLLCINTGKLLSDANRMRMDSQEFYLRSPEEMHARFAAQPEALANTAAIAERCDLELDFETRHFPSFDCPKDKTSERYLRELCHEGLRQRYGEQPPSEAIERLEHELDVICRMGFAGYFLIVWDFVRFARERGIPAGARGSACGALVSYVLGFSAVDPIEYDLLFERFLDPNRNEAPDIDIDFCQERRDEVIQYVKEKYGEANVAQIGTFGTMAARAVVRDVGRVLAVPLGRVDQIAKLIPALPLGVTLEEAMAQSPQLQELYETDSQIKELIDIAKRLEGLARHAGTHAAGVVIADRPLTEYLPLQRVIPKGADHGNGSRQQAVVTTQWPMGAIEKVGLLKMDFLGLRNLTILDKALRGIKQTRGERIELASIPLDDPATFELIQRGDTKGVFQLEAPAVRDILCRMQPDNFRDIIAVNALNRPATLSAGMVEVYINRKHGREQPAYAHPVMEEILRETYGVMVYQEQVMRILNGLGGIELSQAYTCIKAISKKMPEVIARNQQQFLQAAQQGGLSKSQAEEIFNLIVAFGGYGFNKSHSTAYALIAYQTAYLKAHYLPEFMAALLSTEMGSTEKLVEHIEDCRRLGLEVLPPEINTSGVEFTVEGNCVRYGLAALKGIGTSAADAIVRARQDGPFRSMFDLCDRIDARQVNRSNIEVLIKAGALDQLGARRSQLLAVLGKALQGATEAQADRRRGQLSFLGLVEDESSTKLPGQGLPDTPEWSEAEKLAGEKAVLGFYISGHPLARHADTLRTYTSHRVADLPENRDKQAVVAGGMITGVKFASTKKPTRQGNSRMTRFTLEDLSGTIPCVMFPDDFAHQSDLLADERICVLHARVDRSREQLGLIVEKIVPLERAAEHFTQAIVIRLETGVHERRQMEQLHELLRKHPGPTAVLLEVRTAAGWQVALRSDSALNVRVSESLAEQVAQIIGPDRVHFSALGGDGNPAA